MTKLTTYLRRFSPHYRNAFLAALFFLLFTFALCWVFYYSAWLCDDAFITFRSIKHFLNGYGIRWNISDRLQTFTHPLWFLLLSFFSWLTGELYFTTITLSFVFTFLSLSLIILAFGRNYLKSLSLLTVLLLSKSFVDFSSSGLENPLSHFLIAFFLICFLYRAKKPWLLYGCFIISGLGVLTRFDLSLLFFPALLYLIYEYRSLRIIGIACFAFTPLFLWLCFSLFYFGSFFPSPAYAKLGIALPVWDVCKQGIAYYIGTFKRDPIILPTIFISLFVVLISRNRKHIIASLGLILYLLYILRVGGDFMSGRFFTTSLIFATVMLIPFFEQLRLRWGLALSLVIFLISLTAEYPVMKNGPDLKSSLFDALDKYAVADERAFYFPSTGLSATSNAQKKRSRQMYRIAIEPRTVTGVMRVEEKTSVGQSGFFASPDLHILDRYAICDPLLSRVPTRYYPKFRPGHCLRQVPNGYKETLLSGTNVLEDPDLALYCERICHAPVGNGLLN
jgi:arabinofuranosyltransferase